MTGISTITLPQVNACKERKHAAEHSIPISDKYAHGAQKVRFFVETPAALRKLNNEHNGAVRGEGICVSGKLNTDKLVVLGDVTYDPNLDQLKRADGTHVVLRAQSASVLRCLVQSPGILVSRDALIDTVWDGLSVTDDSLTQCIADIRRAIGDTDRAILKTVPKRGFILNAVFENVERASQTTVSVDVPKIAELSVGHGNVVVLTKQTSFNDGRIAPTILDGSSGAQKETFTDLTEAAATCLRRAQSSGASSALAAGHSDPAQLEALLEAARPGEVLTNLDVRDMAHAFPQLVFEDLGYIDDQQDTRAFRLLSEGVSETFGQGFDDQPLLPTISVLPLQNMSQDGSDILGTVFADRVTAVLSASDEINVTSRLSTAPFVHGPSDLLEAGRLLNAEFVLSGMFIKRGDKLQLNLEFTEVASQHVLWALRLEMTQDELLGDCEQAYEIVAKVRRAVLINEIRRANTRPLASLQNYSLMFAAVGLMHRLSPKDFKKARDLIDILSARVPNHPTPFAWRARWHLLRVVQGWSQDPDKDARAALDCTGRALDLDPENVLALACEGHVLTNLLHRLDDAEERYDLALDINPNDANARSLRGMLLAFQDRGEDGVRDTERALHLAPLDPHRFFYLVMAAGAWLTPNNFARSEELALASLRLNRTHTSTLRVLAVAQHSQGKTAEARETVSKLLKLQPDLRVSRWLKSSPSAEFNTGKTFAKALRDAGVPE